jgi:hypothetical protein
VSDSTHDEEVFTRYDDLDDIAGYLPPSLTIDEYRGIRVFTPFAQIYRVPGLSWAFAAAERKARDIKLTAQFGGFLVVMLSKS